MLIKTAKVRVHLHVCHNVVVAFLLTWYGSNADEQHLNDSVQGHSGTKHGNALPYVSMYLLLYNVYNKNLYSILFISHTHVYSIGNLGFIRSKMEKFKMYLRQWGCLKNTITLRFNSSAQKKYSWAQVNSLLLSTAALPHENNGLVGWAACPRNVSRPS